MLNKQTKNLIRFFLLLAVIVFGYGFINNQKADASPYYVYTQNGPVWLDDGNSMYSNAYSNYSYNRYSGNSYTNPTNPTPTLYSVSPEQVSLSGGNVKIELSGSGFVQKSLAEWDEKYYLSTTYDNQYHLTVILSSAELSSPGTHTLSVFNPFPGGGTSNRLFFVVKTAAGSVLNATIGAKTSANKTTSMSSASKTQTKNTGLINKAEASNGLKNELAANAVSAGLTNTFLPSSIIGWLFLVILMLILTVLVRKLFLAKAYHEAPMKHH